ncbi:MAG: YbaB/EbfC family nucleoid-associated protein [Patescibacteria group bacterium]
MFNPLSALGDINKLRQMQSQLASEEATATRGKYEITVSGEQKIKSAKVKGEEDFDLREVVNEALKKIQEIAVKKMMGMSQ